MYTVNLPVVHNNQVHMSWKSCGIGPVCFGEVKSFIRTRSRTFSISTCKTATNPSGFRQNSQYQHVFCAIGKHCSLLHVQHRLYQIRYKHYFNLSISRYPERIITSQISINSVLLWFFAFLFRFYFFLVYHIFCSYALFMIKLSKG